MNPNSLHHGAKSHKMVVQGYGVVAVDMVTGTSSKEVTVEVVTSAFLVIVGMDPQGSVGVISHSQSSATVSSCISTLPSINDHTPPPQ